MPSLLAPKRLRRPREVVPVLEVDAPDAGRVELGRVRGDARVGFPAVSGSCGTRAVPRVDTWQPVALSSRLVGARPQRVEAARRLAGGRYRDSPRLADNTSGTATCRQRRVFVIVFASSDARLPIDRDEPSRRRPYRRP